MNCGHKDYVFIGITKYVKRKVQIYKKLKHTNQGHRYSVTNGCINKLKNNFNLV